MDMPWSRLAIDVLPRVVHAAVARVIVCTVLPGSVYLIIRIAVAVAVEDVQATDALMRYKVVTLVA